MGNCSTFFDELRFDVRDPAATHVYAFVRAEGDCPHFVYGWHHKAYPKSMPTLEITRLIAEGTEDMMTWEREAPRAVNTPVIFNPWERVPVPVEQLQAWRAIFALMIDYESQEMAEQISGHLATVPDWHKACPYCRAHDMMLQAQRNPPQ
jgi:hypothetical protein